MRSRNTPITQSAIAAALERREGRHALPAAARAVLESSFRTDLSAVRVHTGPGADVMARALRADAFTRGADIFFRAGAYRPGTEPGLRLLAHETAHVVQQARAGLPRHGNWRVSPARGRREYEADQCADAVLHGRPVPGGARGGAPVRAGGAWPIQRHTSFEHRVLGDLRTDDLFLISTQGADWKAILSRQLTLLGWWKENPVGPPAAKIAELCPWIRTLTLGPDKILVTYGELNALPDYLSGPLFPETLGAEILLPILQTIRQEGFNRLSVIRDGKDPLAWFDGSVHKPRSYQPTLVNDLAESLAMDVRTFGLGPEGEDHYAGLLARNACHFAPFSWHRWAEVYQIALNFARISHDHSDPSYRKLAWVYLGYADHFLQDSFAAGHLINKTLVMQWWVAWAATRSLGVPDWDLIKDMSYEEQPFLYGPWLYNPAWGGPSNDPQEAQQGATMVTRLLDSTVVAYQDADQFRQYQNYLAFLSSSVVQLASNNMHDYFNEKALYVSSVARPVPYRVWGDLTLLRGADGGEGVKATSEAAQMSQASVRQILETGVSRISLDQIRDHLPTKAGNTKDQVADLHSWMLGQQELCNSQFASSWAMAKELATKMISPRLGILSQDQRFTSVWYGDLRTGAYAPVTVLADQAGVSAASGGHLLDLDPENGQVRFDHPLPGPAGQPAQLTGDMACVYAGAAGYVHAVPRADWFGNRWPPCQIGGTGNTAPVAVLAAGGRLFAASDGWVCELDPATGGRVHPDRQLRGPLPASANDVRLAVDGAQLYIGMGGAVYTLRLSDWGQQWAGIVLSRTQAPVSVVIGTDGLYAGCLRHLYKIDRISGIVEDDLALPAGGSDVAPVELAADGDRVFAGSDGYLSCVVLQSFKLRSRWSVRLNSAVPRYNDVSVATIGQRLYAGSNGVVSELDPQNGVVRYRQSLTWISNQAPITFSTDGRDLFAGVNGFGHKLRARDIQMTSGLAHNYYDGSWHGWTEDFDGAPRMRTVSAQRGSGYLDVYGIGADGYLYRDTFNGSWHGWDRQLSQRVRAVAGSCPGNRLYTFAAEDDGTLVYRWQDASNGYGGWKAGPDGAPLVSSISAVSQEHVELFCIGLDGTLWHNWSENDRWHVWEKDFDQAPKMREVIAVLGPVNVEVFAIGVNGRLWHNSYDGSWQGWVARFDGAPRGIRSVSAVTGPQQHLEVFITDFTGALWHNWYDEKWHGWVQNFDSAPPRVRSVTPVRGPSRVEVFAVGLDGTLWHNWYDDTWHGWTAGFDQAPRVASVSGSMGLDHLEMFIIGDRPDQGANDS